LAKDPRCFSACTISRNSSRNQPSMAVASASASRVTPRRNASRMRSYRSAEGMAMRSTKAWLSSGMSGRTSNSRERMDF
jgi:hypothetical protein